MDPLFWNERWQTGLIGFHQGQPNPLLVEHHALIAGDHRVYVPLCGKALDLLWLRDQGHEVTGSERVSLAVQQLFAEQHLLPMTTTRGAFKVHLTPRLAIVEGDALLVDVDLVGVVDAVYDRAALVALNPQTREPYVAALLRILRPGGHILLVTSNTTRASSMAPPGL